MNPKLSSTPTTYRMVHISTALVIVDVQNDFCAGGSLAVPDANAVIPVINTLCEALHPDIVVLTQDSHPSNHVSFADNHGKPPFTEITLRDGTKQMLWPRHCVQGTNGEQFHPDLVVLNSDVIVKKGQLQGVDSYSGFGAEDKSKDRTNLHEILRDVKRVVVVGLAYDYCVAYTAKDAAYLGYETIVVRSATRPVANDSAERETQNMLDCGVKIVETIEDLLCL